MGSMGQRHLSSHSPSTKEAIKGMSVQGTHRGCKILWSSQERGQGPIYSGEQGRQIYTGRQVTQWGRGQSAHLLWEVCGLVHSSPRSMGCRGSGCWVPSASTHPSLLQWAFTVSFPQVIAFPSSTAPLHSADLCPACTHQAGHLQCGVPHQGLP